MSGICGVIDWRGAPLPYGTLERMADAAKHRAVDGTYTWTSEHAHLAHLAHHITPEDHLEHQPLVQHDLVLVADARIDNRDDLVPILKPHLTSDHPTDADLILAAYRHWGDDSPAHLIGDYAYAIWNEATRTLFAARDPMGMRALYYHAGPHRLTFATEIKQNLQVPGVPIELDEAMVAAYLSGPYRWPERTCYAGIAQLPAGHVLLVDAGGHRTQRSWDIDPEHRIRYKDERDYTAHFLDVFKEAVRARTRTAKPIGIMLSGGMDSGSVASTLGWLSEHERTTPPVHTYSWAFDELTAADERHISDGIVARYGFRSRPIPADDAWPLKDYPDHGPDRDDPFIAVYQPLFDMTLAAARADGVGVFLVGDRGDEMVGDWVFDHVGMIVSGRLREAWHEIAAHASWSGRSTRSVVRAHVLGPLWHDLRRALRPAPPATRTHPRVPDFVRPEWAERVGLSDVLARRPIAPVAGRARAARYGRVFASGGLLDPVRLERDGARYGMGLGSPWGDRRLASFVLAVPQWVLQRPSERKRIARRAMHGIMPEASLGASSKIVPAALFERGFSDRARGTVRTLGADSQLVSRGFVDERALAALYDAQAHGRFDAHDPWWPLTMEMWLRRYWT